MKTVKCKSYYWGFCKETKADENGNKDWCKREKCPKFRTTKDEEKKMDKPKKMDTNSCETGFVSEDYNTGREDMEEWHNWYVKRLKIRMGEIITAAINMESWRNRQADKRRLLTGVENRILSFLKENNE